MTLAAGTKLGPYEIVAPLGAGGMGEVYRARDTRLGRDVAVKVVPASLTASAEVRARFEREARTVSGLNHPNICTLYDVGREGDTEYLVMELIDGETLAQRLARGALPPPDVLKLGEQIADALDRAHRAGVVHRDLKPGNVMLTKSGAKLMDFGLARATGMAPASGSASIAMTQTPTMSAPLTAEGTIVGTFQYMAPEQLEGREADTRSDLWAFGCVLYEMATGKRAFEGRSQASLIAAILERQPDPPSKVAPRVPPPLDNVVARCLAKDPDDRWQNARDLMHELRFISGASMSGTAVAARPAAAGKKTSPVLIAAVAVLAAVLGAFVGPMLMHPQQPRSPLLLSLGSPPGVTYSPFGNDCDLSRDGKAMVMVARDTTGTSMLWVRPLDSAVARPIPGTENATMPFWSPDGKSIAYFAGDKLRRISIAGGTPEDICPAATARGGSWGPDGTILFAPGAEGPLYRVAATGGTPQPASAIDTSKHEVGHRIPRFLPDGKHFFFATTPVVDKVHEIYMGTLGSMKSTLIMRADGTPELTTDGWLLYRRNGMLTAQRFDVGAAKLTGPAKQLLPIAQGGGILGCATTWTSANGVLTFLPDIAPSEQLVWIDRSGHEEPIAGLPVGGWFQPRLSPDGTRLTCSKSGAASTNSAGIDLWSVDPGRGLGTRLTFENGISRDAVWSADGEQLIYCSNHEGRYAIYQRPARGGGTPRFVARSAGLIIQSDDWTRDGRYVVYEATDPKTGNDLWLLEMNGSHAATPLVQTEFNELQARVSPDGHWVAYGSDESGRNEIYVQSFPSLGNKVQVSTNGGFLPQWSGDGHELFFESLDHSIFSVRVQSSPSLRFGPPTRLFRIPRADYGYSVSPDGRRFVFVLVSQEAGRVAPSVMVNWTSMVEK